MKLFNKLSNGETLTLPDLDNKPFQVKGQFFTGGAGSILVGIDFYRDGKKIKTANKPNTPLEIKYYLEQFENL